MQIFSNLLQRKHFWIWGWTKVGKKNLLFSTDKSPYLRNGDRYGQGCYWKSHKPFQM